MIKPTRSVDGLYRFTIRIQHRTDLDSLRCAFVSDAYSYTSNEEQQLAKVKEMTKGKLELKLRNILELHGSEGMFSRMHDSLEELRFPKWYDRDEDPREPTDVAKYVDAKLLEWYPELFVGE